MVLLQYTCTIGGVALVMRLGYKINHFCEKGYVLETMSNILGSFIRDASPRLLLRYQNDTARY